jgi:UPF0755 protein
MKKLTIVIILIIIIISGGLLWWRDGISPVDPNNKKSTVFVVEKGDGIREITNRLKTQRLIKNSIVFFLLVKQMGLDKQIQAGDFRISSSMTAKEIAQNLTHGTLDIWTTIPEGKRATEIADILKKNIPTYNSSWINKLVSNEGYLFPDTYLIPKDASIEMIINQMLGNFEQKYKTLDTSKIKLSKNEIVTLASLVEREAKLAKDKPIVAGILLNRLKVGMKLELCATVQYALGYSQEQKTWWKNGLTFEDIKISSPYNTYVNAGLPPAPIANPGVEALNAVVNPASTDYLYWISDKTGNLHFAKTLEEHNANIKKYGLEN